MTTNSYFSVVSYTVTSLFIKKGSRGSLGPSVSIPEIVQLDRVEFHLQVSVCQNPTATPPPCDLLRILRKLAIALRNPSSSPRPWSHLDNIDRFWLQTSILPSMSCWVIHAEDTLVLDPYSWIYPSLTVPPWKKAISLSPAELASYQSLLLNKWLGYCQVRRELWYTQGWLRLGSWAPTIHY